MGSLGVAVPGQGCLRDSLPPVLLQQLMSQSQLIFDWSLHFSLSTEGAETRLLWEVCPQLRLCLLKYRVKDASFSLVFLKFGCHTVTFFLSLCWTDLLEQCLCPGLGLAPA